MTQNSLAAVLMGAAVISALPANAQEITYKGKTITISVGSSTGGGLDLYGRLIARHIGKHLPGQPTVVISNLPGAGGNVAAIRLYSIAPKDGTEMAIVFPSVLVDPLLNSAMRKDYDPTKFNYVGNANGETLVCLMRKDVELPSLRDLQSREIVIGATAAGSTTYDFPTIANSVLKTRLKIVSGYKGSRDVTLAMESGEVQGICGLGWSTVKIQYPTILKGEMFARVVAQEDVKGHPQLNAASVPLLIATAQSDEDRQTMQAFYSQNAFSRPFLLPPAVEAARIALIRSAFNETTKDADLLAEAAKMNVDVNASTGAEVQALVDRMYASPEWLIDRIRKGLGRAN